MKPKVIVMVGYGINSEMETEFVFEEAGAEAESVHINDLIDGHKKLSDYQIMVFPGGFSYGDDTGSGNAYANKLMGNLKEDVLKLMESPNGNHVLQKCLERMPTREVHWILDGCKNEQRK